jgi:hypothetical protein
MSVTNVFTDLSFAGGPVTLGGIVFQGNVRSLVALQAGGLTWTPIISPTDFQLRRNGTNSRQVIWADQVTSGTVTPVLPPAPANTLAALSGNDFYVGSDNVFTNTGNGSGNQSNVERLDVIFSGGFTVSASRGFSVFERGVTTGHDAFRIALITALDSNGRPSGYGPNTRISNWGTTSLGSLPTTVMNDNGGWHESSNVTGQYLGGVLLQTTQLGVAAGTRVYGYSLFADDVTVSGNRLIDWTNTSRFPNSTAESAGGLDMVGINVGLMSSDPIPEPAGWVLTGCGLAVLAFFRARRKRLN